MLWSSLGPERTSNWIKHEGQGQEVQEPLQNKMRRILESHVDEAKTDEERERAEKALRDFAG